VVEVVVEVVVVAIREDTRLSAPTPFHHVATPVQLALDD